MKIKVSVSRDQERAVGLRQLAIHQWNKYKEVTETDECQFYDLSRQILEPSASLFQRYIYLCQLQVDKYVANNYYERFSGVQDQYHLLLFLFCPSTLFVVKICHWMDDPFFLDKFEIKVKL